MARIEINPAIRYLDNTQRVLAPETTLENTVGLLAEIGVTRIASITDLDRVGIPVYSAIRPSAAKGAISVYSGKGADDTVAKVSTIMESFERCLAEQPEVSRNLKGQKIRGETHFGTPDDLAKEHKIVEPNQLLLPSPLPSSTPLEWVLGWDLLNDEEILVPANAVYHPYTPIGGGLQLFRSNTNGLAAGNTIEEAVLHGLLEVIERDALSAAEYTRNPGREILLDEKDGINFELKKRFENSGILVKLWLLNSDVAIPTVVAALDDSLLKDPALLVMGAGSHLRPEIAVTRALTEAAQSRVVQIHGAREDTDREMAVRSLGYETLRRLNKFWYNGRDTVGLEELEDKARTTPAKNIETILECLEDISERAIIVDLSRSTVKVPVIRAIIPTFELFTLDRERRGKRLARKKAR